MKSGLFHCVGVASLALSCLAQAQQADTLLLFSFHGEWNTIIRPRPSA